MLVIKSPYNYTRVLSIDKEMTPLKVNIIPKLPQTFASLDVGLLPKLTYINY
jgi:hypothetical protein